MKNIIIYLLVLLISSNGMTQKDYTLLYPNNNIKVKGHLIDGKKVGLWEAYDTDKKMVIKREYNHNFLVKNFLSDSKIKEAEVNLKNVLWSKRVERILASTSVKNQPLYNRQHLKLTLLENMHKNNITSYTSMKLDSILTQEDAVQKITKMDISQSNFYIKEDWYFNKKTRSMEVMIISLSIIDEISKEIVSFYFPELKTQIGKEKLIAGDKKITLEDYFLYRLFESEITKESSITEKKTTTERTKEIEKLLLDMEINLWLRTN